MNHQTNHYVSTYQKDYTWHLMPSKCRSPTKPIVVKGCCTCIKSRQVPKKSQDRDLEDYFNWSRMGPMGRLLEPKIYPKIERDSEADGMRLDQLSSTCIKEYPDTLKKPLPKKIVTQVDADRMKTTYQVDYSDPAARLTKRDMALTVIDKNDQRLQRSMSMKIIVEVADCPSYCRLHFLSDNGRTSPSASKSDFKQYKNRSKREKKFEDVTRRETSLPSWKSEYQDSINKIGLAIMRVKLHHAKKKALPIQYQYSRTASS